jgi:hypothetical protein
MTPTVRLSANVYARLQKLATPFVDTEESVFTRLLDFYERPRRTADAASPPKIVDALPAAKIYNPDRPPDLTHTKMLSAEFAGTMATNWNDLMDVIHRHAAKQFKTYEALRAETKSNMVRGKKTDSGFHHLPDIDVSIQGVGAPTAWRNALHLARRTGAPIRVEFEWRDKPEAAHPGKRGLLEWAPPNG